jgi:hypothetical protein
MPKVNQTLTGPLMTRNGLLLNVSRELTRMPDMNNLTYLLTCESSEVEPRKSTIADEEKMNVSK